MERTDTTTKPSEPEWAGAFTEDYFSFVRRGWWHLHDAETGSLKGIVPVTDSLTIQYDGDKDDR